MVISRRTFAENLKEMHGIKKKYVKGVQNFCFCQLSMQILWSRRFSRVVDLKLPNIMSHLHSLLVLFMDIFFLYMYLWQLTLVSANHALRNSGQELPSLANLILFR